MKNAGKGRAASKKAAFSEAATAFRGEIGERLRWLLDLFPTRSAASEVAGVNTDQLANYVAGRSKPPLEVIARLCRAKSISIDWLTTGEGLREPGAAAEGAIAVPMYDVRAGAGAHQLANNEEPDRYLNIDADFLALVGVRPENAFVLITDGPSMEETIRHGEPIVADKSETEVRDAIFVMRRSDGILVKRIQRRSDGSLMLISDNPAYPPELLPRDEADDIQLIGRVKGVVRRL